MTQSSARIRAPWPSTTKIRPAFLRHLGGDALTTSRPTGWQRQALVDPREQQIAEPGTAGAVQIRETRPGIITAIWSLLILNTLDWTEQPTIFPFPHGVAQILTMCSLLVALGLAILANPQLHVHPSPYLFLLTLLLLVGIASSLRLDSGVGSLFRCVRTTVFLSVLWLITPWWTGDLSFVRRHIRVLTVVLISVYVGMCLAPGKAFGGPTAGRLVGTLWPIPAPQVGEYGAITAGLCLVLLATRSVHRKSAWWVAFLGIAALLMSHTRTATIALLAALAIAVLSHFLASLHVRRLITAIGIMVAVISLTLGSTLMSWFARGQDTEQLNSLTGRKTVWDALLAAPRSHYQQWLGSGLTNRSFNGLPIDNSWLAIYQDQGLIGITIVAIAVVGLLIAAVLRPPSPARACAFFLISYCAIASYTEVGLGDASPYILHLTVAATLLTRQRDRVTAWSPVRPRHRLA